METELGKSHQDKFLKIRGKWLFFQWIRLNCYSTPWEQIQFVQYLMRLA